MYDLAKRAVEALERIAAAFEEANETQRLARLAAENEAVNG